MKWRQFLDGNFNEMTGDHFYLERVGPMFKVGNWHTTKVLWFFTYAKAREKFENLVFDAWMEGTRID